MGLVSSTSSICYPSPINAPRHFLPSFSLRHFSMSLLTSNRAEGTSADNMHHFALSGGEVPIGPIGVHAWLIGYRSPNISWDFRYPPSPLLFPTCLSSIVTPSQSLPLLGWGVICSAYSYLFQTPRCAHYFHAHHWRMQRHFPNRSQLPQRHSQDIHLGSHGYFHSSCHPF